MFTRVELSEAFSCPVCKDVMDEDYDVFTLSPCNHKVCDICVVRLGVCPTCRCAIELKSKDQGYASAVKEELRKRKCEQCNAILAEADTRRHYCLVDSVRRLSEVFPSFAENELKRLLLAHQAKGHAMDPDTLGSMLLEEQADCAKMKWKRARGTIAHWEVGTKGGLYGFIQLANGDSSYLHHTSVKHGDAARGKTVSVLTEPSKQSKHKAKLQAYDVVVLEDGEDVGIVCEWDEARGAIFVESGDRVSVSADFVVCEHVREMRVDATVVFSRSGSGAANVRCVATRALEKRRLRPQSDSPATVEAPSTQPGPAHAPGPEKSRVTVLWDFSEYGASMDVDVRQFYLALVNRLVGSDPRLPRYNVSSTAFGFRDTFSDEDVLKVLQDMNVEKTLVSNKKPEDLNRTIVHEASLVVKNGKQETTEVVLISSDTSFTELIGQLEASGLKTMVVHGTAADPYVGRVFELRASLVVPWSTLHETAVRTPAVASEKQPTPRRGRSPAVLHGARRDATHSISPSGARVHVDPRGASVDHGAARARKTAVTRTVRTERLSGMAHRWPEDTNGNKYTNIATPNGTVFLHSSRLVRGVPTDGCRVSFRVKISSKGDGNMRAHDVVVLGNGEQIGTITSWGLKDKKDALYGIVGDRGFFLHAGSIAQGTPALGAEVVFTSTQAPAGEGKLPHARDVTVLTMRV